MRSARSVIAQFMYYKRRPHMYTYILYTEYFNRTQCAITNVHTKHPSISQRARGYRMNRNGNCIVADIFHAKMIDHRRLRIAVLRRFHYASS